MIVFDLGCEHGHVFEAWFGSSADFEDQKARGLLTCPVCDSGAVSKALMAPAIPAKGNRGRAAPPPDEAPREAPTPDAIAAAEPAPGERLRSFMKGMADVQAKIESECDYVGRRFADEARAIHYGETEQRGIYGETTPVEADALRDEGVSVSAMPFRSRRAADA